VVVADVAAAVVAAVDVEVNCCELENT